MNLIKLSEQLKDVPDNYLAQEIQKPTGNYPAYLIISELSRRKRMRDGVAKPEPQTTVAEDLAGQGGIADTPQAMQSTAGMDVMGAEEPEEMPQMAGGGLVAFQGGKLVRQQGGLSNDPLWQMAMENQPQYQGDEYARDFPDVRELPGIYRQIQQYSTPISEERRTSIREEGRRRRAEEVPFGREEEARRISAREQALEGERSSNVNMALMEAGLGMMASRAPRGIQGVAEGGLKGLSALRAGKQDIKKSEAYLDQAKDKYAQAKELYDERMYAAGDRAVAEAERQQALGLAAAQARFSGVKSMLDVRREEEMRPLQRRAAELGVQLKEQTMPFEVEAASLKPALARSEISFRQDQGVYYRGRGGQGGGYASPQEVKAAQDAAMQTLMSTLPVPGIKGNEPLNPGSPDYVAAFNRLVPMLVFQNKGKQMFMPAPGQPTPQPGAPGVIRFDESGKRVQ